MIKDKLYLTHPKYAKHCGCQKRKSRSPSLRSVSNITGGTFGELFVERCYPEQTIKGVRHRAYADCRCSCGAMVQRPIIDLKRLGRKTRYRQTFVNCGDLKRHLVGPTYPPTPTPYPEEAWDIVKRYTPSILSWYERDRTTIDSQIEDCKKERLQRVAYIIYFRRKQGERIDDRHERSIVFKYFRFAKNETRTKYWRIIDTNKKGSDMTDLTMSIEPVIETLAGVYTANPAKIKRFRRR